MCLSLSFHNYKINFTTGDHESGLKNLICKRCSCVLSYIQITKIKYLLILKLKNLYFVIDKNSPPKINKYSLKYCFTKNMCKKCTVQMPIHKYSMNKQNYCLKEMINSSRLNNEKYLMII